MFKFSKGDESNVIRFRNPGSNLKTQLRILQNIHTIFADKEISLDDMKAIATNDGLMTSHGYAGEMAVKLNEGKPTSRDGVFNNVKMYAEIFRMMGLLSPANSNTSYPVVFTYIGHHIANIDNPQLFVEECFWGLNNPTRLTDNLTYDENVRFLKCTLRMMIDLGGIIYKHELCLGSMSVNDTDEHEYQSMVARIKAIRGDKQRLEDAVKSLADSLCMQVKSVDNCTRIPIGVLKYCGYVEDIRTKALYNINMQCIKITDKGIRAYERYSAMKDIRLSDFEACNKKEQDALIRLGIYSMLQRSGFNLDKISAQIEADKLMLNHILHNQELLFSPCATLKRERIEELPEFRTVVYKENIYQATKGDSLITQKLKAKINILQLTETDVFVKYLAEENDVLFLEQVNNLRKEKCSAKQIVDRLYEYNITAKKDTFYPLIATLFRIIGFDSEVSRDGDNGSRFDVVIKDRKRSIAVEVKSPTEEMVINAKAVRQALENKIVLLSRKKFITDRETTSLAIGYSLPNERSEIQTMVQAIKETYGFSIGVIDLKSLLAMAVFLLIDGKSVDKEKIFYMEGLNYVKI